MNLQIGGKDGSRMFPLSSLDSISEKQKEGKMKREKETKLRMLAIAALMVALDMIHVHKHTKSWALEIILITDGE